MNARVKFVPVSGLDPRSEGEMWLATSPGPLFQLVPQRLPVPPGWYRLRLRLRRVSPDSDARLYIHPADGSPMLEMRLPMGLNGQLDHLFRLPVAAAAIELRPFAGTGAVQLDRGRLYPLGAPLRVLLMLARVGRFFRREGDTEELRRLAELPVHPDISVVPDGSRLERLYRIIKRRMVLRSLSASDYPLWIAVNEPPHQPDNVPATPRILSVIIPLGQDDKAARQSLESVRRQNLQRFECLLVHSPRLTGQAAALCRDFPVARSLSAPADTGSHLLAAALHAAQGAWILCLLPGDQLAASALAAFADELEHRPELDVLYADEDRLGSGGRREHPLFKPDWDPELMLGFNYLGPSFACRRESALRVLPATPMSPAAALFHLALWLTQGAGVERIGHLSQILLHRRTHEFALPLAEEKLRVAQSFCAAHRPGFTGLHAGFPGLCHFYPPEPAEWPLVSVVIPTRNGVEVLRPCLEGLLERTDYPCLEILVADNGSDDPETLEYLQEMQAHGGVRVLRLDMPFNYSRLNNICAREATGQVLVFLNNDVEVVRPGWLKAMTGQALRPDVGAVGALLLYPNGLVQHAGIVLGRNCLPRHAYRGVDLDARGLRRPLGCTRSVLAVTGACMALRRELFLDLGGFDEELAVAYNDVDLCLRLVRSGRRNLLVARAVLVHHESFSRKLASTRKKGRLARREAEYLARRWQGIFSRDPYCNPNISGLPGEKD